MTEAAASRRVDRIPSIAHAGAACLMTRRHPIGSRTAQARQLRGARSYNIATSNMAGAAIDRASAPGQHLAAVTVLARDRREGRVGLAYPEAKNG